MGIIFIISGIITISALLLKIPIVNQLQLLIIVMAGSGIASTSFAYVLYHQKVLQKLGRLKWTLFITSTLSLAILMINIWILTELSFVDNHYTSLTNLVLIFSSLSSLGFIFFISKAITDRIEKLSEGVRNLARGDLTIRVSTDGNDEIASLIQSFNDMAQNLYRASEEKKDFENTRRNLIAWVSHDLRTPLTSMRVMLEALDDGIIQDQMTQQRYIRNTLAEIEHLSRLIEDLFEIAQLDVGHIILNYETTSLPDLISDTISKMTVRASHRQIRLNGNIEHDINFVVIAADKIQRVLYNIVDNAIEYGPADSEIFISVHQADQQYIQINILNTKSFISDEVLPHIFDSFYRGDNSRKANEDNTRGTGLGLTIARGFVEAHKGMIWVESTPELGTKFSIKIPEKPV